MNKVLIVSVHPDDEVLGCGGTILKHRANNDTVFWLILTDVTTEHGFSQSRVFSRDEEIRRVSEKFGFQSVFNLKLPTMKIDTLPIGEIVLGVSKVMTDVQPAIVYMINRSDIHSDHKVAFQAILSCTKNFRYPFINRILSYECLSETEFAPPFPETVFLPNVFVDITEYFDSKIEIMKIYESEVMDDLLPRSLSTIEALARFRGSQIGAKYAEAFMLIKEIL